MSIQCFTCDPNPDLLLVNVLVNVVRSIRRHLMLSANYNWFQFASGMTLNQFVSKMQVFPVLRHYSLTDNNIRMMRLGWTWWNIRGTEKKDLCSM